MDIASRDDDVLDAAAFPDMHLRQPLDRVFVREHHRAVDLLDAAGRPEEARLRFDVVLEVIHSAAAMTDQLEQVLSHHSILNVIDKVLADASTIALGGIAERIAMSCLAEPRAVLVHVRAEKLDREKGALGVEIIRKRPRTGTPIPRPDCSETDLPEIRIGPRPFVAYLPAGTLASLRGNQWCEALAGWDAPFVICTAPLVPQPSPASDGQLRIGLLAVEQSAWALSDHDPRFQVVASRGEIEAAFRNHVPAIWAPTQMVMSAGPSAAVDASDPAGLAIWLTCEIDGELVLLGDPDKPLIYNAAARHAALPEHLPAIRATQATGVKHGCNPSRL
jgi:7,8-dihydroneopterin aldolase/epimerase/oxygenase